MQNDWLQDIQMRQIPVDSPFDPLNPDINRCVPLNIDAATSTIENINLMEHTVRYPLCVDPFDTVRDFLVANYPSLIRLNSCDEDFLVQLIAAISAGDCCIVDDIDEYVDDLNLKDLLEKNYICKY